MLDRQEKCFFIPNDISMRCQMINNWLQEILSLYIVFKYTQILEQILEFASVVLFGQCKKSKMICPEDMERNTN